MRRLAVAASALGCLSAAACGSLAQKRVHASAAKADTVVMRNIAFNPHTIHVQAGQTITWVNRDDAPHNVTYVSGPRFTSSATFKNGGSFTLKLTHPGTIHYICTIHPGMNGTIVVSR
ncbi:MAG TPA: plastocyanin/azurin family copper-binding protein [Solirubrobacteraceae bacterium]|jgi:plastocyanin|nr:plastocyanin/azurin family copper-binding protein [Solirubrobacteraceae bacterium]